MAARTGSASRYAIALFSIATERGTVDTWAEELARVASIVTNPDGMRILTSPAVDMQTKRETIETLAGPLSKEPRSLVTILLQRNRIELFPKLAESFATLARKQRGIEVADVTSAIPLGEADRAYVAQWLQRNLGQTIELHTQVDAEIIGGIVARVGDELIDASVRGKLETLRRTLRHA